MRSAKSREQNTVSHEVNTMLEHPELFRSFDAEKIRAINNSSYIQQNSYSSFHDLITDWLTRLSLAIAEKTIIAAWHWLKAKWNKAKEEEKPAKAA
jgi:hypothetical protein